MEQIRLLACVVVITVAALPVPALAWNIPGHMLSAAIAYQVLQQESPQTIEKVKAVLEKHPWYANQWQARLQDVPVADHGLVLFMQAARWADDIRSNDKQQHRALWHYINWPFKPDGQPPTVQIREPEPVNILTALAENESVVKNESDPERKAIALAWLFHLVGDIHQPLHTAQLFTVDYPQGDRGGNEICVRVTQARATDGPAQVLGRRDYLKLEFDTATKRGNGAPKPPGVSAQPAHRTCEHRLRVVGKRELRDCDEDRLPERWADWDSESVEIWTARWSQRLPCFLWDTLLVRAGLLIDG